jgi:hypothetical protein
LRRTAALLLALFAAGARPAADVPPVTFVQAVEFPYYLYPPHLWERELVWLKNIGITTIEFTVPSAWHKLPSGQFDFTGSTSPRRDLTGFVRLLRRVGLQGWVTADSTSEIAPLAAILAPQTVNHGGPIAWADPLLPGVDAPVPLTPVNRIPATGPDALAHSRDILAATHGSLLWTNAIDALYPAGWTPPPAAPLVEGAVGLDGEERSDAALRRDAALLRGWAPLLPGMHPGAPPKPAAGKFPAGISAAAMVSNSACAVSIVNRSSQPFQDDVRVTDAPGKRTTIIPGLQVPAGESLWLPVNVSLSQKSLCRECSNFSPVEEIAYATVELLSIEFENGILALEFAAPERGELVLQLEREPVGPYIAGGKPTSFEWDEKTLRARLPIPASNLPDHHVRVGLAMEEPETSAFFDDAKRLIIGAKNVISTTYSSPGVASRSRLRLPEGFSAAQVIKAPNQIDYEISVPATAAHGDHANLALEVDGVALSRARPQLFRPLSLQFAGAMEAHFGPRAALPVDPPIVSGGNIEIAVRNNWPGIQTYKFEAAGDSLEFFPPKTEITIGATDQREIDLRMFAAEGVTGLRDFRLHVTGGATLDLPVRTLVLPRGGAISWSADLDEDGSPEWVLESAQARAVFSTQDGGRWMEFTWKDGGINFLPLQGALAGAGPVTVHANGNTLEFAGNGWTRTARLDGATLTMTQTPALPADNLTPQSIRNINLAIARESASRVRYTLSR